MRELHVAWENMITVTVTPGTDGSSRFSCWIRAACASKESFLWAQLLLVHLDPDGHAASRLYLRTFGATSPKTNMNNDFLTQQSVLCRASRPLSFTETIKVDPAYHSSCAIFIIQVFWGPRCNDSVRRCSPSSPSYYDDLVLVPGAPFRPRCALKRQLVIMVLSQTPLTQRCTTISSKHVFGSKLASITLTLNQLHCVSSYIGFKYFSTVHQIRSVHWVDSRVLDYIKSQSSEPPTSYPQAHKTSYPRLLSQFFEDEFKPSNQMQLPALLMMMTFFISSTNCLVLSSAYRRPVRNVQLGEPI